MPTAKDVLASETTWSAETARLMMPILIERATAGKTITYGGMDQLLASRHSRHSVHAAAYGYPAGRVGNVILALAEEWGERIPPLNLILVNQQTGLPGSGADYYLDQFVANRRLRNLDAADKRSLAESAIEKVFDYPRWDSVADYFGISLDSAVADNTPIPPPPGLSFGFGGESDAHRSLKEWVAKNPKLFSDRGAKSLGEVEVALHSGDRIDVLFKGDAVWLGVEVKPLDSPEGEHWRGVFQCVKYRATLRAMRMVCADVPNIKVLLVTEHDLSPRVSAAAKRLQVDWLNVTPLCRPTPTRSHPGKSSR